MSLPPERISIKRRRQDDPVETLYLELGNIHDPKRRFTDFCFHRLKQDQEASKHTASDVPRVPAKQRSTSSYVKPGMPFVRATRPGDELKETLQLKESHRKLLEDVKGRDASKRESDVLCGKDVTEHTEGKHRGSEPKDLGNARRFHLVRDNKHALAPKEYAGVHKSTPSRKSHVAIFVEKSTAKLSRRQSSSIELPVDRIVYFVEEDSVKKEQLSQDGLKQQSPKRLMTSKENPIPPFVQSSRPETKTGQSIRDPPSTWDHNSDQLADELAALALEFDPAEATLSGPSPNVYPHRPVSDVMDLSDDEFIYDTYLRLPADNIAPPHHDNDARSGNVGVLVINEDDRDLWETYAECDDDEKWDEEDADSNAEDNPVNEYPEDEVSSGDEYGYNAYRYRRNASDEEEFDVEDNLN